MEVAVPSRALSCGALRSGGGSRPRWTTLSSFPPAPSSCSSLASPPPISSPVFPGRASLSSGFIAPFVGGSVAGEVCGQKLHVHLLKPSPSGSRAKRGVVTMVIPFLRGSTWEQPPPDLASYLYKNRIVYLGMSLVPSVTELMLAEFLYLQHEDEEKPIYLYLNFTGTTKLGFFWGPTNFCHLLGYSSLKLRG